MTFDDLRTYVQRLSDIGELVTIEGAHWDLEIGAIASLTSLDENPPAVLFDQIPDYPHGHRILCDVFNGRRRLGEVLRIDADYEPLEWVRILKDRLRAFKGLPPIDVGEAPVQQHVVRGTDVNLFDFPAPRWFEGDGGRFLGTNDVVITSDPDTDWVNLGTYRVQIHDETTAGICAEHGKDGRLMMERYWAQGRSCPVAVCLGQEPAVWLAATQGLPYGQSEFDYAGWINGAPIRQFTGPTTGLPIPASAEIVLEGEIPSPDDDMRLEGPFGEWEGYYASGGRMQPVIKVKSVMFRDDPIVCGLHRVRPHGGFYFNNLLSCALIWNQMEDCGVSGVRGVWQMEGAGRMMFVVSVQQRYAGHAKRAAYIATGGAGSYGGRYVVLVDDDIDPTRTRDVLWAIATRCDPEADIEILRNNWGADVDPVTIQRGDHMASRAIIDACRPFNRIKEYPPLVAVSAELHKRVTQRWGAALGHSEYPPAK